MPKSLKFRLNGNEFNPQRLDSTCSRACRYLDSLKFCELLDTRQVAAALDVKQTTLNTMSRSLTEYTMGGGQGHGGIPKVWGSKKTIAELKRQITELKKEIATELKRQMG